MDSESPEILHPRPTWSPDGLPFFGDNFPLVSRLDVFMESAEPVEPGVLMCNGSMVGTVVRSERADLGQRLITYRLFATPADDICPQCLARSVMDI